MKHLKQIIFALALMSPLAANADAISMSETGALTTEGGTISLQFSGLSESDGTDGTITLANESGSTFDLFSQPTEFVALYLDGLLAGLYTCHDNTPDAVNMGCDISVNSQNTFSYVLSFSQLLADFAIDVPSLISDGILDVLLDFGPESSVGLSGPDTNNFVVQLDYHMLVVPEPEPEPEPEVQPVPEPGTLALLGLGLAGMGMTRRRKTV